LEPAPTVTYALPTCHAALGRTASDPRGAGWKPACQHPRYRCQVLAPLAGWKPAPRSEALSTAATTATIRFPFVT